MDLLTARERIRQHDNLMFDLEKMKKQLQKETYLKSRTIYVLADDEKGNIKFRDCGDMRDTGVPISVITDCIDTRIEDLVHKIEYQESVIKNFELQNF